MSGVRDCSRHAGSGECVTRFREWLIPELLLLSNDDARRTVHQHAVMRSRLHWWLAVGIALSILPAMLIPRPSAATSLRVYLPYIFSVVGMTIAVQVGILLVGYRLFRPGIRRMARDYMRRNYDVAICVPCGYDLTGNASGVCPECGAVGGVEREMWRSK